MEKLALIWFWPVTPEGVEVKGLRGRHMSQELLAKTRGKHAGEVIS